MTKLSPIESEFETAEDAEAYDKWFRAKVQTALDSTKPLIPHKRAMAELDARIAARRARAKLER
jgi:hypothetical protein